ncbi:MAG: hypothetical protein AB7F75_00380 [Planctomycetota bacterium]
MKTPSLFGAIALRLNLVNELQLNQALEDQTRRRSAGKPGLLGEILRERHALTEEGLRKVLEVQKSVELALEDTLFGELAISHGFITAAQLDKSLARQREDGFRQRIGSLLVAAGSLEPGRRDAILAAQSRLRDKLAASTGILPKPVLPTKRLRR